MARSTNVQRDLVKRCFGGGLYQQGRGFYAGLELFAILRGVHDLEVADGRPATVLPPASEAPLRYLRRSHDFARRMPAVPEDMVDEDDLRALDGPGTRQTLAALVDALVVPAPGGRGKQVFKNRLLFPYVGELIHFDAVDSLRRRASSSALIDGRVWITLERYTFRGAGGLAHKMLRTDPDTERLKANRQGFLELVSDSGTPLGRLANALRAHDRIGPESIEPFEDDGESEARVVPGGDRWVENLRDGVRNIVGRETLPRSKRVELLLHWVPYCLARYQLEVAFERCGEVAPALPVDLRFGASTVRVHSQTLVNRCPVVLGEALARTAEDMASAESDEGRQAELMMIAARGAGRGAALKDTRAFFTSTLYAVGGLNAPAGLRHFTLKLPLVETLVVAGLSPGAEMSFHEFCQRVLFQRYGLVLDGASARQTPLATAIDTAEFDENSEVLARQLGSLGLMTEYSDDTRLVHAEVRR